MINRHMPTIRPMKMLHIFCFQAKTFTHMIILVQTCYWLPPRLLWMVGLERILWLLRLRLLLVLQLFLLLTLILICFWFACQMDIICVLMMGIVLIRLNRISIAYFLEDTFLWTFAGWAISIASNTSAFHLYIVYNAATVFWFHCFFYLFILELNSSFTI